MRRKAGCKIALLSFSLAEAPIICCSKSAEREWVDSFYEVLMRCNFLLTQRKMFVQLILQLVYAHTDCWHIGILCPSLANSFYLESVHQHDGHQSKICESVEEYICRSMSKHGND